MKKTTIVALSAIPGLVVGYAVLSGMLMKRINPVPIVATPETVRSRSRKRARELVAGWL